MSRSRPYEVHTYSNIHISQGILDGLVDWTYNLDRDELGWISKHMSEQEYWRMQIRRVSSVPKVSSECRCDDRESRTAEIECSLQFYLRVVLFFPSAVVSYQ